jgi:hypothetical protein
MPQPPRKAASDIILTPQQIERSIYLVRGHRVLLDEDLARLYGVPTKALNQTVRRNLVRFPKDFAFQLTSEEVGILKSQFVTSSWGGRRKVPWVFTEHGVAMLSSVLRSETAAKINIQIMRAFVRLRRLMATPGDLAVQLRKLAETVDLHDDQIKAISRVLQQLIAEPPPPKEMGFHTLQPKKREKRKES